MPLVLTTLNWTFGAAQHRFKPSKARSYFVDKWHGSQSSAFGEGPHRIIEQFGLKETFKGHLVQPPLQ